MGGPNEGGVVLQMKGVKRKRRKERRIREENLYSELTPPRKIWEKEGKTDRQKQKLELGKRKKQRRVQ